MHSKDFVSWHDVKVSLDANEHLVKFNERDIWWCSVGVNVGHESDGKGSHFNRPVLVVRKFNRRMFWGVPLSSQMKDNPHYHRFTFRNKPQAAMLTQMRLWDAQRLTHKMGRLPREEFLSICGLIRNYLPE